MKTKKKAQGKLVLNRLTASECVRLVNGCLFWQDRVHPYGTHLKKAWMSLEFSELMTVIRWLGIRYAEITEPVPQSNAIDCVCRTASESFDETPYTCRYHGEKYLRKVENRAAAWTVVRKALRNVVEQNPDTWVLLKRKNKRTVR